MVSQNGYSKVAHLYDMFDAKENIGFFLGYAGQAAEILDIGAGTGRIAIPIAESGARVWCVEPSTAMLGQLRLKLMERPEVSGNITIVEADACGFKIDKHFTVALMSGSFDHLLDNGERSRALSNIADHLEVGGRLVFDVGLGYMDESPLTPAGEKAVGARTYRRFVGRKVVPDGCIDYTLVFEIVEEGKLVERIEQKSTAGIIDRPGLHRLLDEACFRVAGEYGGYDRTPYSEGDEILVVEAVKRGRGD
jgi:SAM-dependent methyltransferase